MPRSTFVIVITGLPCSGKSTLAAALQSRLHWPLLAKDVFKESLFDLLGYSDRDWSRRVSAAAYSLLFAQAKTLIDCRQSCLLEGNFRATEHARFDVLAIADVQFVQVHCHALPEILIARYNDRTRLRNRHPGHVDALALDEINHELSNAQQTPLLLPRASQSILVSCDTSTNGSEAIEVAAMQVTMLLQ